MSVLTDLEITDLVKNANLIENFHKDFLEGASYDMRLGSRFVKAGTVGVFDTTNVTLHLDPGEFALLCTHEELNMPTHLIGHNGITSPWAKRGLVSLFSPQIDPGFAGQLHVPVFNAGDRRISLTHLERIFTVEFVQTTSPASYSWSDRHGRQKPLSAIPVPDKYAPKSSEIDDLRIQIDALRTSVTTLDPRMRTVEQKVDANSQRISDVLTQKSLKLGGWGIYVAVIGILISAAALWVAIANSPQKEERTPSEVQTLQTTPAPPLTPAADPLLKAPPTSPKKD